MAGGVGEASIMPQIRQTPATHRSFSLLVRSLTLILSRGLRLTHPKPPSYASSTDSEIVNRRLKTQRTAGHTMTTQGQKIDVENKDVHDEEKLLKKAEELVSNSVFTISPFDTA
jgi:hypothetical protein